MHCFDTTLVVFTDASTDTSISPRNSGLGFVIQEEGGKTIWEGGTAIRTDGNNYTGELAAITLVLEAIPRDQGIFVHVLSDAEAALFGLMGGPLSERKGLRSASRAWSERARRGFEAWRRDCKLTHATRTRQKNGQ